MKVSPIAILLVGLLAVVLFFPNILSQFGIPGIEDFPLSQNTVGVGVTLHFADGTSETYEPKEHYTLIPLTVTYDSKILERIEFLGRAKITYHGELETVDIVGTFVSESGRSEFIKQKQISLTQTSPHPSDQWFVIADLSVSDTEIEGRCQKGMASIHGIMEITELTTTTREGKIQTFQGSATSGVIVFIEFDGEVSAISLEVKAEPLV